MLLSWPLEQTSHAFANWQLSRSKVGSGVTKEFLSLVKLKVLFLLQSDEFELDGTKKMQMSGNFCSWKLISTTICTYLPRKKSSYINALKNA